MCSAGNSSCQSDPDQTGLRQRHVGPEMAAAHSRGKAPDVFQVARSHVGLVQRHVAPRAPPSPGPLALFSLQTSTLLVC